jgi:hypothetical protein
MEGACTRPECTVAQTGRCVLNNDPATCPERLKPVAGSDEVLDVAVMTAPALSPPTERARFPHSLTLSPSQISEFSGGSYQYLVGILGSPDAGKTAILVSLYLLLTSGQLTGYRFADSKTLMALDEISRGARRWNKGERPKQMTSHTELPEERVPGFLHLRVRRLADGNQYDVLLPDLPGEWSDALIDHDRTDRLSFLKSADILWLTLDGMQLRDSKLRQQILHRAHLLMQRISALLSPNIPPVLLVLSHLDMGEPEQRSIQSLQHEAGRFGIDLRIVNVASFSDAPAVLPGTGIADLMELTLNFTDRGKSGSAGEPWPDREPSTSARFVMRFRNGGSQ